MYHRRENKEFEFEFEYAVSAEIFLLEPKGEAGGGAVLGPLLLFNPLWRLTKHGRIFYWDLKTSGLKLFSVL
jgi:hypothetical protein